MALAKLVEKRTSHLFMIDFFSKKAMEMNDQSSQAEIVNRMKKLNEVYEAFQANLRQLEAKSEYEIENDLAANLKAEEQYITALSTL